VNSEVEIITEPLFKDKVLDIIKGTKEKITNILKRAKKTDDDDDNE